MAFEHERVHFLTHVFFRQLATTVSRVDINHSRGSSCVRWQTHHLRIQMMVEQEIQKGLASAVFFLTSFDRIRLRVA